MEVFKTVRQKSAILKTYDSFLDAWGVDFKEIDVEGAYGTTHCIEAGNPKAADLVLFHGVGDNSALMWTLNIRRLAEKFHCIAVDTLGGPGKSAPNGRYEADFDQVAWITSILDYFKIEKANIAGVSNGGYMAYNYCVKMPGRVNKIIGIEGGFVLNPLMSMIRTIGLLFPEILFPTKKNMMRILAKLSPPESEVFAKRPDIVEYIIDIMKAHNQKAMFKHALNTYEKSESDGLRHKMLFLFGDYMIEERARYMDLMRSDGFAFKVMPNAGHALNMEQPESVDKEIIDFLIDGGS